MNDNEINGDFVKTFLMRRQLAQLTAERDELRRQRDELWTLVKMVVEALLRAKAGP